MKKLFTSLDEKLNQDLENSLKESLKNEDFCNLLKRLKISKELAKKFNSSLLDTCEELNNCNNCKGLFACKNKFEGHVLYPSLDNQSLKFIYMPCKYQKELEKKKKLSNELANSRMKDIDITDKKRVDVIKWLKDFYDSYEKLNDLKGLYLHGSFGSGKSFLISALFNELSYKKNARTEIIYFPEFLRTLKDDFSLVDDKIDYLQSIDLLLIDDIGAENLSTWGRDEILGTILQYRMNNKLTTFFTSNLNIEELENHLSITKAGEDKIKARRIIERIKQLTVDKELVSVNRRK